MSFTYTDLCDAGPITVALKSGALLNYAYEKTTNNFVDIDTDAFSLNVADLVETTPPGCPLTYACSAIIDGDCNESWTNESIEHASGAGTLKLWANTESVKFITETTSKFSFGVTTITGDVLNFDIDVSFSDPC